MSDINRQNGLSTIAAIMMIVILGILGTVFVAILNVEQYGFLNYYENAQSFASASAGAEWGLKQRVSTATPIPFAGGTLEVSVAGDTITATGIKGGGKRIIEITALPLGGGGLPQEGCEKFIISDSNAYAAYETAFNNPVGGVGDQVCIQLTSTEITGCSGGHPNINEAEIKLQKLGCPDSDFEMENLNSWSCSGPLSDGTCFDYYVFSTCFNLPGGWSNTSASMKIELKDGGNRFEAYDTITIGNANCSSVKFYSDAAFTSEVFPWELDKGSTYYIRVITSNLNNGAPTDKKEFVIQDFQSNDIFKDEQFFTLNGTQSITCGGNTYNYGSYEGSFTVPNAPPPGWSKWRSEPVSGWHYDFSIKLDRSSGGNCEFRYLNTLKIR